MKILFINSVYKEKSTGRIVQQLMDFSEQKGHDVFCIYGRGKVKNDNKSLRICFPLEVIFSVIFSRLTGRFWNFGNSISTRRAIRKIEKFHPDVINIHQIYGYYINPSKLIRYLVSRKYPVVITLHDFTFFSGKCGYPITCEKYLSHCLECPRLHEYPASILIDRTRQEFSLKNQSLCNCNFSFIAVSEWLNMRAKASTILKKQNVTFINNGINETLFYRIRTVSRSIKKVLCVCTNFADAIKGGKFLCDTINSIHLKDPSVKFVLVGGNSNSLIPLINDTSQISFFGRVNQNALVNFYNEATISFVPSISETFSLPTIESLCCGTPVFGPAGCGAPEFLFPGHYCDFSTQRDPILMATFLLNHLEPISNKDSLLLSEKAANCFRQQRMATMYLDLFKGMTKYGKK